MSLPYKGRFRITKLYGTPPPSGMSYSTGKHAGIDFVGVDSKDVLAVTGGTCIRSAMDPNGWGNYIVIRDENYSYIYAHLHERLPQVGNIISAGDKIGVEGNTGKVTGSHLHFEIRREYSDKFSTINPAPILEIADKVGFAETLEAPTTMTGNNNNEPNIWAKDAWEWAKKENLLDGTNPKDNVTREELAVVLQRLYKKTES